MAEDLRVVLDKQDQRSLLQVMTQRSYRTGDTPDFEGDPGYALHRTQWTELDAMWDDGTGAIVVPLCKEDTTSRAGIARPTVSRVVTLLQSDGLVSLPRGRTAIHDLATLQRKGR
jgi:CRP-like cAMP-binding protein